MKIKNLKKIDNFLGSILLIFFWPLAFVLSKFLSQLGPGKNQICVLKILGGGSLLMAYPALVGIKERHLDKKLILVCSKEVYEFSKLTNIFDTVYTINTNSVFSLGTSTLTALKGTINSGILINLEMHSKACAIFSLLTLSRKRVALFQTWNKWQKNYINHPIFFNSHSPIYGGYEQICHYLNGKVPSFVSSKALFSSFLPPLLPDNKETHGYIVGLAPFCSDLCSERAFYISDFVRIVHNQTSLFTGELSEIRIYGGAADYIKSQVFVSELGMSFPNVPIINLVGKLSLIELAQELRSIKLLITIDSGVNHLARLLDTRIASYWGPTDPALYLKEIDISIEKIFYQKIPCSPCVHITESPPCNGDNVCLKQFLYPNLETKRIWEIKS